MSKQVVLQGVEMEYGDIRGTHVSDDEATVFSIYLVEKGKQTWVADFSTNHKSDAQIFADLFALHLGAEIADLTFKE